MAAKKQQQGAGFARLLDQAAKVGKVIEFGDAKIRVLSPPVSMIEQVAKNEGDADQLVERMIDVFIKYAVDPEDGQPYSTDRDAVRENVPTALLQLVFNAAFVPDPQGTAKN